MLFFGYLYSFVFCFDVFVFEREGSRPLGQEFVYVTFSFLGLRVSFVLAFVRKLV